MKFHCLLISLVLNSVAYGVEQIPIGISVWDSYSDVFTAMQYALEKHTNDSGKLFQFTIYADRIRTVDAYKLTRIVCRQFERGIFAMVGTVDPESLDTLHSYANAYEMPFVTPWFPESREDSKIDEKQHYTLQIRPEYHSALMDLITYYGWSNIIYIYSDFDGLLRLQKIFKNIPRNPQGQPRFHIDIARRISTVSEAIDFLLSLERHDRDAVKHIVLDCSAQLAKDIIVQHVRSVHLGRRNYHYLMAGLVLDDFWDTSVIEYGAINMTGLRLVNTDSFSAREFFQRWRELDRSKYQSVGNQGITATGALAYDAITVLEAGFKNLLQQMPNLFRSVGRKRKGVTCDMAGDERQQHTWEHGREIAKALKNVQIEGLTGLIRFDETGRRVNYTLDVLEMTAESQLVKVGTWGDRQRLQISMHEQPDQPIFTSPPTRNQNKSIYILTSVLEPPFLMYKRPVPGQQQTLYGNARFEGYTKDLADLLSQELNLKFEIRPVKDGQYGVSDPSIPGGWTGMIGELVRSEADIAISPLTINAQREQVVDFTVPFMQAGISIMMKRSSSRSSNNMFSFLSPLSSEIWTSLVFAYFGVGIVMFLVSRFSPCEWRIEETVMGTKVKNPFSIGNSLFFALGTFMHQYTALAPRSIAGRMVGGAWWFFSLIIIAAYTSNMAAILTVERMEMPVDSVDDLAAQTAIEYGTLHGGSSMEFFKNSRIDVYKKVWEFMTSRPYVMVNSSREGVDFVRESEGRYAFLLEAALNDYYNSRFPCDTVKVGKNLDYKGYGIATSKASGLHASVNQALLNLQNMRVPEALQEKWWKPQCSLNPDNYSTRSYLSLSNVVGVFFFLAAFLVIAMFIAILEFCFKSNKEAKRAKTTLSDAMRNKARLALGPGRDGIESVRFYGDSSAL